jgi:hypothetical protein
LHYVNKNYSRGFLPLPHGEHCSVSHVCPRKKTPAE